MTELNADIAAETEPTELEMLKRRAIDLGVPFSPNIGVDTLRERVANAMQPKAGDIKPVLGMSAKVAANSTRMAMVKEAKKLVRIRIMNMNQSKKDWKGEIFTVSNSVVGTIKRFVPYDVEWHCEEFILKQIKARQMSRFYTVKTDKGMKVRKYRLVPEFSVEVLPDLTVAEVKALADDQTKRGVFDGNQD